MTRQAEASERKSENEATLRQTREPETCRMMDAKRHVPDGCVNSPRTLERGPTDSRRSVTKEEREQMKQSTEKAQSDTATRVRDQISRPKTEDRR